MPPRNLQRPVALASAFALGVTVVLTGPTVAGASPGGDGNVLTASNGSSTLRFASGASLTSSETIKEASWAPDGSRAIFISGTGQVKTLRHDNGQAVVDMTRTDGSVQFSSPSYRGDGAGLVMAVKQSTAPWQLAFQQSSSAWLPVPGLPSDGRHYLHPDAGPNGLVVYQAQPNNGGQPTGTPSIGVYDAVTNVFQDIVPNAGNPSISPNGDKVAFVRPVDGVRQIFVADVDGTDILQVTSNAVEHDNPVWSPTGSEIAFSQGASAVATTLPDGSTAANPTVVPNLSGIPAYQPHRRDTVLRLAGVNRIDTAVAVSQSFWEGVGEAAEEPYRAQSVVLSRSDLFADALGGAALAAAKKGPLLMTVPTSLAAATQAEMQRILAPGSTVYLLGGTGALSATVESQVRAAGFTPRRLSGASRYDTSVAIANAIDPTPDMVFAATAWDFPDALAAGAAAGSYDTPGSTYTAVLVLTNNATLPTATRNYLDSKYASADFYAIGGQAVDALWPYDRYTVFGRNRYETAREVAYSFFGGSYYAGIATGTNWPDALAGGALLGTVNGPLLLTAGNATALSGPTQSYLSEHSGSITGGLIFGGPGVVVPELEAPIGSTISGPGGYDVVGGAAGLNRASGVDANGLGKRPVAGTDKPRTPAESEAARDSIKRPAGS